MSGHQGIHGSVCPLALGISSFLHFGLMSYITLITQLGIGHFFPMLVVSALVMPSRHHSACPWDFQFLALWVDILRCPNDLIKHWLFLSTLVVSALVKPSRHHSGCPWDFRFLALWVDVLCHPNNLIRHRLFLFNACGVSLCQAIKASTVLLVLGISGFLHFGSMSYVTLMT